MQLTHIATAVALLAGGALGNVLPDMFFKSHSHPAHTETEAFHHHHPTETFHHHTYTGTETFHHPHLHEETGKPHHPLHHPHTWEHTHSWEHTHTWEHAHHTHSESHKPFPTEHHGEHHHHEGMAQEPRVTSTLSA